MKHILALILGFQAFAAFATTPVFSLVPVGTLPTTISAGGTANVQYTVTNTTTYTLKNSGLRFAPEGQTPVGATQVTGGVGVCANPFTLAAGESCTLNLLITADNLVNGTAVGGPEICNTISHPAHCSIPSTVNQLNITPGLGLSLVAGVDESGVLPQPYFVYSADSGSSWSVGTIPNPAPDAGLFYSSNCYGTFCSIAGILQNFPSPVQPYILYSTSNSGPWHEATITPSPAAYSNNVVSNSCGPGICVAVGQTITVGALRIQSTDNGASWQMSNDGVSAALYVNVSCSTNICVAVGSALSVSAPLLAQTTNGGTSWTFPVTSVSTSAAFRKVSCDASLCVAVGNLGADGMVYVTTDAGANWAVPSGTLPNSLTQRPLESVACTGTTCVAGGTNSSGSTSFLMISTDSGQNWSEITTPTPTASQSYSSIGCSPNICVAVGNQGNLPLITQSVAPFSTWTTPSVPYPEPDTLPLGVSCNVNFCIVAGATNSNTLPFLVQTQNAGTTWTTSVVSAPGLPTEGGFPGPYANTSSFMKHKEWDSLHWFMRN